MRIGLPYAISRARDCGQKKLMRVDIEIFCDPERPTAIYLPVFEI
jgi:hypothetical protein